jgi:hypothetical protein
MPYLNARLPGIPTAIHANGVVAEVMGQVCDGVIGASIAPPHTWPSTHYGVMTSVAVAVEVAGPKGGV